MKKKKICALFAAFVMLFFTMILFSSDVSAKKQQSLNTSVKNFMKYARAFHLKGIRSSVDSFGNYGLLYYTDVDNKDEMYKYYKKCARKMTYKILSKKQGKKTAVVKVKVRYVNSYRFTQSMVDKLSDDLIYGKIDTDDLLNMNEKKMTPYINNLVKYSAKRSGKIKYRTQTIKLTFVKKEGKWKIKKMTKALDNVLQANIPVSLEKIVKDLTLLEYEK